jgi:hypothetical protein
MGLWNSTLVYVGARTLLAAAMLLLVLRRRRGIWFSAGQVVSDLACAAFLLGYVNPAIREDIGLLVVPLLLFVLYWELSRLVDARRMDAVNEEQESLADAAVRAYEVMWTIGFVFPALLAGAFLVFDVLAPAQWPFPNPRPPLVCTPKRVERGDTVMLRMRAPHGAELVVFTPRGRALTLRSRGFRDLEHFGVSTDDATGRVAANARTEPVFVDSGVYTFVVSELSDASASRTCRVRFAGIKTPPS